MLFPETHEKINESVLKNQIRTREIIADTPEARRSAKRAYLATGKSYSVRLATEPGIKNDSCVYGNTVALFRIYQYDLFVVRIEDPTIASTMKAIFDMAWKSARPFIG